LGLFLFLTCFPVLEYIHAADFSSYLAKAKALPIALSCAYLGAWGLLFKISRFLVLGFA
jgi:hypothetical protein